MSRSANQTESPATRSTASSATATHVRATRSQIGLLLLAIPRLTESISTAEHRGDNFRMTAVSLDLATKVLDVRIDAALVTLELVAADPIHELRSRVHPSRNIGERKKDPPLGRCQLD